MKIITQFNYTYKPLNAIVCNSYHNYPLKSIQLRTSLISDFNSLYSNRPKDVECNYSYCLGLFTTLSVKYQLPLDTTISFVMNFGNYSYDNSKLEELFNDKLIDGIRIHTFYLSDVEVEEKPLTFDKYEVSISYTNPKDDICTASLNAPLDYPSNVYSNENNTYLTLYELLTSVLTDKNFLSSFKVEVTDYRFTTQRHLDCLFDAYVHENQELFSTSYNAPSNIGLLLTANLPDITRKTIVEINSITITKNSVETTYNLKPDNV